jgi:hypothetical protein
MTTEAEIQKKMEMMDAEIRKRMAEEGYTPEAIERHIKFGHGDCSFGVLRRAIFEAWQMSVAESVPVALFVGEPPVARDEDEIRKRAMALYEIFSETLEEKPLHCWSAAHLQFLSLMIMYWRELEVSVLPPEIRPPEPNQQEHPALRKPAEQGWCSSLAPWKPSELSEDLITLWTPESSHTGDDREWREQGFKAPDLN